jgi:hypothetical protein
MVTIRPSISILRPSAHMPTASPRGSSLSRTDRHCRSGRPKARCPRCVSGSRDTSLPPTCLA